MTKKYNYQDLKYLMARLRHPQSGCPWDIEQTYESIVPHTLEEVYEVIDTIERADYKHLKEELGDLLFQVVFYAQIAKDEARFELDDVIHSLVAKLVHRHPHVFPEGTLTSHRDDQTINAESVSGQWDAIKQKEKKSKNQAERILDDIPKALPGLLRAKKIQKRAAKVGFDWPDSQGVLAKIREELDELEEAIQSKDKEEIESELGDVLFALSHLTNHLKVDPERAVRKTNAKFEYRFGYIEDQVNLSDRAWSEYSLEELEAYWQQAKTHQ
ncbi:nucleoside triphosphate pyrophosphohydrolase [Reinekea forsetii]|nr:nucleoside triphosphate pyrophosphohydrolase [Reinekea forsetii]